MMHDIKYEASVVKTLGDQIGYGHLMTLASVLWANKLEEQGYPRDGAFVPTVSCLLTDKGKKIAAKEDKLYKDLLEDAGF